MGRKISLAFLFGVFTARAERSYEDGPAAILTIGHRFSQQAAHQRAAAPAAAWSCSDAGAFADLLKGLRAGVNRFEHGAFTDLVANAGRFEILDNGFCFRLLFR
jgi:hypothetical protein